MHDPCSRINEHWSHPANFNHRHQARASRPACADPARTRRDSVSFQDFSAGLSYTASVPHHWRGHDPTQTTVRLAGGKSGQLYLVTNRVTLDSGQVLDASILIRCQEQWS